MKRVSTPARELELGDWILTLQSSVCQIERLHKTPHGVTVSAGGDLMSFEPDSDVTVCIDETLLPVGDQFPVLPMLEGGAA